MVRRLKIYLKGAVVDKLKEIFALLDAMDPVDRLLAIEEIEDTYCPLCGYEDQFCACGDDEDGDLFDDED